MKSIFVILLLGFVSGCVSSGKRPSSTQVDSNFFSVCFIDPEIGPPDAQIVAKVEEYTSNQTDDLVWKQALMTHESGGERATVSPTGAVGLFSVSSKNLSGKPCCLPEADDRAQSFYDICDSEELNGYHCDPKSDARFLPEVSMEVTNRILSAYHSSTKTLLASRRPSSLSEREGLLAFPVYWSVGPEVIQGFPEGLSTLTGVFSKLDFTRSQEYNTWSVLSLANKWVEIFDSIRWFEYLVKFWNLKTQQRYVANSSNVIPLPKFNCASYDPHRKADGSRIYFGMDYDKQAQIEGIFQKVRVKRRKFGRVFNDWVYVGNRGQFEKVFPPLTQVF